MSVMVTKGTRVKMRFADGSTLEWKPLQDETLEYALSKVEELAHLFTPVLPDSGAST